MAIVSEERLPNATATLIFAQCLINVGESLQRFCMDNNIKLSKLNTIMVSSLSPHHTSGLPGLIIALSGLGLAEVNIIGPPGLDSYVNATKAFANRRYVSC